MTTRTLTALCLATALLAAGATTAAEVPEGINVGIKVHGHWKIEILEPDGTLVSSHEFDNSYQGWEIMFKLLNGQVSQGLWGVYLAAESGGVAPCLDDQGLGASCLIAEPGHPPAANHFLNLTISGYSPIIFAGTATAARQGSIGRVVTMSSSCDPSVAPASCTASVLDSGSVFTAKFLDTTVPVLAGQIIQVTVTITFS